MPCDPLCQEQEVFVAKAPRQWLCCESASVAPLVLWECARMAGCAVLEGMEHPLCHAPGPVGMQAIEWHAWRSSQRGAESCHVGCRL